jgi:hypothetical protein
MRYSELLADLAQIARRAGLVLHHRGAADHFQVRDLREVGQDLVLHTIGEESVRFLFAQIFKGKNGDAFFRYSRYYCRRLPRNEDESSNEDRLRTANENRKGMPRFLLPRFWEKDILVIKAMEIINARLFLPLGVALVFASVTSASAADLLLQKVPALTIEQAPLYPQNLARIDLGAQVEVTPKADSAQNAALLSEDPKVAYSLSPGTRSVLISLAKIERVSSCGFVNADAKGSVAIATAIANLDPASPQWRDAGKVDLSNGALTTKIGPTEAKYVRLTFDVTGAGRLSELGVYGIPGVADFTTPRPRRVIEGEIAQASYNLTDLHTKARVLYVSSGVDTRWSNRMIDNQPSTVYSFAASDNAPAAIIDFGREMTLRRISVLSSPGAGTANFYVLDALPVSTANTPDTLRLDEGMLAGMKLVGSANDDGTGRAAVDFPETSGRYVLVKWSLGAPSAFSVAEIAAFGRAPANMLFAANRAIDPKSVGDAKDGKDVKDFKDIPAEGPEAPAEGPSLGLPQPPPFVFIPQIVPTSP